MNCLYHSSFRNIAASLSILAFPILGMACTAEDPGSSDTEGLSPEEVFRTFQEHGLTCQVQVRAVSFDEEEKAQFSALVLANFTDEEIGAIVGQRERGCVPTMLDGSDQDRLGQAHQAITNSYVVEQMEERTGSSGYYPFSLYRDSSTYGWMCNDGAPESPADIIGHFHVPGAFANRPSLKIRGTNSYASCFIKDPTSARVYSDNDIRACIGADRVVVCAVIYNQPYEVYWSDMIAWW